MRSIRMRLMLVLVVGFAVLITVAGFGLVRVLGVRVTEEFDSVLLAKARAIVSLVEEEGGQIEFDYDAAHMPAYEREERPDLFQFWLDDGRVLLRSSRLEGDLPHVDGLVDAPVVSDVDLPDGRSGRQVQIAFVPKRSSEAASDGDDEEAIGERQEYETRALTLVVARDREDLDALLGAILGIVFGVGGVAVVLAVVIVWRALATGLRPLAEIATQVETLDADRLGERVGLDRTPEELGPIVDRLNALLGRLEASFEREQRFTGNVAHELKTPIAELRSLSEVGTRWPEDAASVKRFFEDVHDIAGRMEVVIADLLLLARCHAGVIDVETSPTNLRQLVDATWARIVPTPAVEGHRLTVDVPDDLVIETDEAKLSLVVTNLLVNAATYAPPRSEIACTATSNGEGFRLEIANAAERLTPEDLERLAEPFWRHDESRASPEHAGLGLAVARELLKVLGLELRFALGDDGIFHAAVERQEMASRGAAPGPGARSVTTRGPLSPKV